MNFENNSSRLELMIEKNNQDLQERCDKMQKQLEALQCETIRTRTDSRCNIFTANLILSILEFAIWITLFIFGLGRNIISKDYWQFYEKNYNLSIVAFFVIFGILVLEIYGTSGTSMSNYLAMIGVYFFSLC